MNTTAVILAGGASERFGDTKGLASLAGRPLVNWVATAAGAASRGQLLVLAPGTDHGPWRRALGASRVEATLGIVHDADTYRGPVAGLRAAVDHVETPFVLVLAVDMPLVRPDLLLGLEERLVGHDAVAFHLEGWWRPLPSVWRTASLEEALDKALMQNVNSLRGLLDLVDARPLGPEFLALFSEEGTELRSINTPGALATAEAWTRARQETAAESWQAGHGDHA